MATVTNSGRFSLLLGLLALCGCSGSWSPAGLAARTASADKVIAIEWYHGATLTLTNSEAAALIRTLASAKGGPKGASAATAPCCMVQFFRGTNLLASIFVQESWLRQKTSPASSPIIPER